MHFVVKQDLIKENPNQESLKPHVDYMYQLIDSGKIIVSGPFADKQRGGMFILETESEAEVKQLVEKDPAVIDGILKNEIRAYNLMFLKK